jgi:hypothetical protein
LGWETTHFPAGLLSINPQDHSPNACQHGVRVTAMPALWPTVWGFFQQGTVCVRLRGGPSRSPTWHPSQHPWTSEGGQWPDEGLLWPSGQFCRISRRSQSLDVLSDPDRKSLKLKPSWEGQYKVIILINDQRRGWPDIDTSEDKDDSGHLDRLAPYLGDTWDEQPWEGRSFAFASYPHNPILWRRVVKVGQRWRTGDVTASVHIFTFSLPGSFSLQNVMEQVSPLSNLLCPFKRRLELSDRIFRRAELDKDGVPCVFK